LPILRHDADDKGAGKRPVLAGWEAFAEYGAGLPTVGDLADWEARFGHAPGTGLPMGNEVAIDLDLLRDPALADHARRIAFEVFGPTSLVRVGQAPKVALVYRAAEPIDRIHLKTADGSGDGVDVLGDGAQLVAFGIHRDTRGPYHWESASPLTDGPDAAPAITSGQVKAFLAELGRFVELTSASGTKGGGAGVRGGGGGGGLGAIVRNAEGRVVDGREAWLTLTVHRLGVEMNAEGALEAAALAGRAWAAFEGSANLADEKWTPREALRKAEALVRRVKAGKVDLGGLKLAEAVEPTYPDRSKPVEQARLAVEQAIRHFLAAADGYREDRAEPARSPLGFDLDEDCKPTTPVRAVPVATGVGKTALAAKIIAETVKTKPGWPFLYCVPTHRLGDNIVADFARYGVTARVFRGRSARDPDRSGRTMCDDLAAVELALDSAHPPRARVARGNTRLARQTLNARSIQPAATRARRRASRKSGS
jgi:hypothetical protein